MREKLKQFVTVVRIVPKKKFEGWKFSVFKRKKNTLMLRLKPEIDSPLQSKQVIQGKILLPTVQTPLMIFFFPSKYDSYKEAEYLYTLKIENTNVYKILIPEKNRIQRKNYTKIIKKESFEKHMLTGKDYLEHGEFKKAEKKFKRAIEENKNSWKALWLLAQTQFELKQFDKARITIDKAKRLKENVDKTLETIGEIKPLKKNKEIEELEKDISDAIKKEEEKERKGIEEYINQVNKIFENQIKLLKRDKEISNESIKLEIRAIVKECLKNYPDKKNEIIKRIKAKKEEYLQKVEKYHKRKEKALEKQEESEPKVTSITIKPIGRKTLKEIKKIPDEKKSYEEILYEEIIPKPEENVDALTNIRIIKQQQKSRKQRQKILKQRQELTKSIRAVINKIHEKVVKRTKSHMGLNKKTGALWKAILWEIESKHGIWETSLTAQNISKRCETIRNSIEKLEKIREKEGLNGKRRELEAKIIKTTKKRSVHIQEKIKEMRREAIEREKKDDKRWVKEMKNFVKKHMTDDEET